jgi:hypothetical protein
MFYGISLQVENLGFYPKFIKERCLPEYVPVPVLRIDEQIPAMHLIRRASDRPEILKIRNQKTHFRISGTAI